MSSLRPVLYIHGFLLVALAGVMLMPALADAAVGNPDWQVFVAASAVAAFFGGALLLAFRTGTFHLDLRQMFLLTGSSWIVVCLFAALPFRFAALELTYPDAFFETMSGLTTTGSTVLAGLERLPPGILLWRSLLQGLGGIGIIVVALGFLPLLRVGGMQLFHRESSDIADKPLPRATAIATRISAVYSALLVLCALTYWTGGMKGFDAISHALTTVSTGGYSTYDASFGAFDSAFLDVAAIVFMLLGSFTFTLYLLLLSGRPRPLFEDPQIRAFLRTLAVSVLALTAWLVWARDMSIGSALRYAAFNVVSITTTTGYATADYSLWGPFAVVLFFVLTFAGGCSGSTAGGIKTFRFMLLWQVLSRNLRRLIHPREVISMRFGGKPISEALIPSVIAFLVAYLATVVLIALALGAIGLDPITAISGAATAVGNVGPGLGETIGPAGNFAPLPDAAKWLLSFGMLLGRLEFMTLLVLISPAFWKT